MMMFKMTSDFNKTNFFSIKQIFNKNLMMTSDDEERGLMK